jgi:hypothetical protein
MGLSRTLARPRDAREVRRWYGSRPRRLNAPRARCADSSACLAPRLALQWRMPELTRRRSSDHRHQCWQVYYGDIHAGTISERVGNPRNTDSMGMVRRQRANPLWYT